MKRKHVLTLTPSPTLDLSGVVDRIVPNEKNYVHEQIKAPGGNGINAARILTRLGVPTIATGFLGGSVGEEIKFLLRQERVQDQFVPITGHSRICVTVSNRIDQKQTRLTFPGPTISSREKAALIERIRLDSTAKVLVVGGSLPKGFLPRDARRLIEAANQRGLLTAVDCPGKVLRELISARPYFIKPNLVEFQEATRTKAARLFQVFEAVRDRFAEIPYVCVSSVEGGALLVTKDNAYFGRIPKIKILSTVGAGDSMVGAMVAQFFRGNKSDRDILRWGLAAAAATLSRPGTAFGTAGEIRRLYRRTQVESLR